MKTICISAFEGVEIKNVLRTPILTTLLREPDVRILVLMKNHEMLEYCKKDFCDSRIIYEVVPCSYVPGSRLDAFFERLKFLLLQTETTDFNRKMISERARTSVVCLGGQLINRIMARPSFVRLARWLDYRLLRHEQYATVFEAYHPDVLFLAHIFEKPETNLLREARRRGIPAIGFIHSWDKVTTRGVLRLLPDTIVAINHLVKSELVLHDAVSDERIFVSGVPNYDHYFEGAVASREDFFRRIGINASKRLILYAPMGRTFSDSDWDMIDHLHALEKNGSFGVDAALFVRFQPNDVVEAAELAKRPWLVYDHPGTRFSDRMQVVSSRSVDWDMDFNELQHLKNTLYHASLLICYASSVSIDAAIFNVPIININFEIRKSRWLQKNPTNYYQKTHYKKALNTGAIRLVHSTEELTEWVRAYLRDPFLDRAARERLVKEQCAFLDGKAGERIGAFIIKRLRSSGYTA